MEFTPFASRILKDFQGQLEHLSNCSAKVSSHKLVLHKYVAMSHVSITVMMDNCYESRFKHRYLEQHYDADM